MNILRNRWCLLTLGTLLLLSLTAISLVVWAGWQIASPPRRPLMAYHREFLSHPQAHGMNLASFTANDGTPCLLCTPDTGGNWGKRGLTLRQQLAARGLTPPAPTEIRGTLVLLHGRKGRKEDFLPIAERFCAAGFRCILPDLPAHGDHPLPLATYGIREATLPARVLDEAARTFSFPAQPAGLIGMSMGGSISVHAASLPDAPWKALAILCSFDSFSQVIEDQACETLGSTLGPWWARGADQVYQWKTHIPLSSIQPCRHAAAISAPTFIAHGSADSVARLDRGRALFHALPPSLPKQWIEVPGAGHDNLLITTHPLYADLAEWMLRHLSQ